MCIGGYQGSRKGTGRRCIYHNNRNGTDRGRRKSRRRTGTAGRRDHCDRRCGTPWLYDPSCKRRLRNRSGCDRDCAPLWHTVEEVINATHDLHVIHDATRGGVGTVLYEMAGQSNVGIRLNAEKVPVAPEVKGVCGMLGLEPLYLACEGRMVIMAPKAEAEKIVEVLHKCPYSQNAAIIGEVTQEQPGKVVMTTEIGTQALLPQPERRIAAVSAKQSEMRNR